MDINDRIKQILVDKSISPSHFADEIGVQRSSISHILAGRNRPSLDIVQKIIKRYPELGLDWILEESNLDEGESPLTTSKSANYSTHSPKTMRRSTASDSHRAKQPELWDVQSNPKGKTKSMNEPKTIERILIFYSDGTFRDFTPASL